MFYVFFVFGFFVFAFWFFGGYSRARARIGGESYDSPPAELRSADSAKKEFFLIIFIVIFSTVLISIVILIPIVILIFIPIVIYIIIIGFFRFFKKPFGF